jgi:hypothetical protein
MPARSIAFCECVFAGEVRPSIRVRPSCSKPQRSVSAIAASVRPRRRACRANQKPTSASPGTSKRKSIVVPRKAPVSRSMAASVSASPAWRRAATRARYASTACAVGASRPP